jgi:hypothetical protein
MCCELKPRSKKEGVALRDCADSVRRLVCAPRNQPLLFLDPLGTHEADHSAAWIRCGIEFRNHCAIGLLSMQKELVNSSNSIASQQKILVNLLLIFAG